MDSFNYENSTEQNQLYNTVRTFLHDNEQLLWIGRPSNNAKPHMPIYATVFPLFFLGFAIFWTITAAASAGAFGLFGIPFLLVGGYMGYNTFIGQKKRLKNTVYVVTDRRAMIVYKSIHGVGCNDYYFSNISNVSLTRVNGTVGTICFEQAHERYYDSRRGYGYQSKPLNHEIQTSFVMIENVQHVYRLISDQISSN